MQNFLNLAAANYFTMQLDITRLVLTLAVAFLIGLFVFFIYKITFGGVMYSRSLNISYIMLTLVTSLMLMLISNNLTLSLGMVGALSIIRFRTAVKDPIDTVFMFWAVGEGIAIGVAFFLEAAIAALLIGIALVVLNMVKVNESSNYLLIVHYTEDASNAIKVLQKQLPKCSIKSKTVNKNAIELTLEVRLRQSELNFTEKLVKIDGILDAMLVSHKGDIVA
ncbi:MAG: DUF4956 domain-containing protein [Clostridiales bacterium]|jgi:uncharacterized membrane protein YhiD involved in acid resistance|nr:DUF4956 domain-containing protein [Clostridiales bacterium]